MTRSLEWSNWSGLESSTPSRVVTPSTAEQIAEHVVAAGDRGERVKMVGTGHSFTGISAPVDTMLAPHGLAGILSVDREAMTVTAAAGTRLKDLNAGLAEMGLSLHNMGDIAEQTLAGATSTGTHGTGGRAAGLAAQIVALELVTGEGEIVRYDAASPEFDLVRVGLGALGILTSITFAVEELFVLRATEEPMSVTEFTERFDDLIADRAHLDAYWFPHTDRLSTKRNVRTGEPLSAAEPLSRWRKLVDDQLLSNTLFGAETSALNRAPGLIPRANRLNARLLGGRTYSDIPHRVFTAERHVVFKEMEYAVPLEAGLTAWAEAREAIERAGLHVSFPVEIRVAPADDPALSTSSGRDSFYLAFHTHARAPHAEYFDVVEHVMKAHGGRPHWGKVHSLVAADFEDLYPRFGEFCALRDKLDPQRVFANPYLERVLGR